MIKVSPDTPKIIALEGMVDELTTALAAKTEDFGRLCKDFDAHDAELKRIIAGLRAELAQAKIYMPARSAEAMPKTENGPCNYPYWRILEVTA